MLKISVVFVMYAISSAVVQASTQDSTIKTESSSEGEITGKIIAPLSTNTFDEIIGDKESALSSADASGGALAEQFLALLDFLASTSASNKEREVEITSGFDLKQASTGFVGGDGESKSILDKDIGITLNTLQAGVDGDKSVLDLLLGGSSKNKDNISANKVKVSSDGAKTDVAADTGTAVTPNLSESSSSVFVESEAVKPIAPHWYPYWW
eukprot:TRINITY_DN5983_c0_g1_i1.p2 TRINITY_DN5983_c0_g1~~TRINITY_DN5983_c0_g1_i1.p2  ORF type:complete len:244 (-),score=32.11 TRINITY_DN5983_c0_g1_i1:226-858(-)